MSQKRTAGQEERPVRDVWPERRASDAELRRIAERISGILTAADAGKSIFPHPGGENDCDLHQAVGGSEGQQFH